MGEVNYLPCPLARHHSFFFHHSKTEYFQMMRKNMKRMQKIVGKARIKNVLMEKKGEKIGIL